MIGGLSGLAAALAFGFFVFATTVMREEAIAPHTADGIVVLTGGDLRISTGSRLLRQGKAQRMLITGVNAQTRKRELFPITGLTKETFACCVDLDYKALNTVGNATEIRKWANLHMFRSLIVVTSSYHMPRSLTEIARLMPDATLHARPVLPERFREGPWWLDMITVRILISEYVKLLPSAARFAAVRLFVPGSKAAVASTTTGSSTK